jgi:hypothetical protein
MLCLEIGQVVTWGRDEDRERESERERLKAMDGWLRTERIEFAYANASAKCNSMLYLTKTLGILF